MYYYYYYYYYYQIEARTYLLLVSVRRTGVAVCLSIGQWGLWRLLGGMFGLERDLLKSKPCQVSEYVQSTGVVQSEVMCGT